jgi:hypothetical protein
MTGGEGLCVIGSAAAAALMVRWVWRNWGDRPARARAEQRGLRRPPTDAERALHLPADEASVRALNLGPRAARIVQVFKQGELARGAVLDTSTITSRSRGTTSTTFVTEYAWYDRTGRLHTRRTDKNVGLLNQTFTPSRPDDFLVAFDAKTGDHVVFFGTGGQRVAAPPFVQAVPTRPQPVRRDGLAPQKLVESAAEHSGEPEVLLVIIDALLEHGDPLGEHLSLALARTAGGTGSEEEGALWRRVRPRLQPPGTELVGALRNGFPQGLRWRDPTDPTHLGWTAARRINVVRHPTQADSPFVRALPNLRELEFELSADVLPAEQWARVGPHLEVLFHHQVTAEKVLELRQSMASLIKLRRYEVDLLQLPEQHLFDLLLEEAPPHLEEVALRNNHHPFERSDLLRIQPSPVRPRRPSIAGLLSTSKNATDGRLQNSAADSGARRHSTQALDVRRPQR